MPNVTSIRDAESVVPEEAGSARAARDPRRTARVPRRLVTATLAALLGILTASWVVAHFVLDPTPGPHRVEVTVTALPAGGRVGLQFERSPGDFVPITETIGDAQGRWEVDGDAAVATETGRTYEYLGPVGDVARLRLETGPRAGEIEIRVDDAVVERRNLRSWIDGQRDVRLEFASRVSPGIVVVWLSVASLVAVLGAGVLRRLDRNLATGRARLAVVAAIVPVGWAVVAVTAMPAAPVTDYEVVVQPLGGVGAGSAGVGARLVPEAGRHVDIASFAAAGDEWLVRDGFVIAERGDEAALTWSGRASPGAQLQLTGSGGSAEVVVNGERRVVETSDGAIWSTSLSELGPDVDAAAALLRNGARLLDFVVVGWWTLMAGLACAGLLRGPRPSPERFGPAFARRMVLLAAPWLAAVGVLWPGIATPDTLDMMFQVENDVVSEGHPVVGSLSLHVLRAIVDSLGFVAIVQVLLVAASCALLLTYLELRRAPRAAIALSTVLAVAWPGTWVIVVSVWKDLPFAAGLMGLTYICLRAAAGSVLATRTDQALFVLSAITVWSLRGNGPPVVLAVVVVLGWLSRRRWRATVLPLAAAVIAPVVLVSVVGTLLDAKPSSATASYANWHIANHLRNGTRIDADDLEFLRGLGLPEDVPYDCQSINSSWFPLPPEYLVAAQANADRLRSIAIELDLRDPVATARHVICASQLLWKVNDTGGSTYVTGWGPTGEFLDTVYPTDRRSAADDSPATRLALGLHQRTMALPMWMFRPAVWLYVALVAAAVACWRTRALRCLLVFLPSAATVLTLAPLNVSQDVRYLIGPTFITILLAPSMFLSPSVLVTPDVDAPRSVDPERDRPGESPEEIVVESGSDEPVEDADGLDRSRARHDELRP